MNPIGIYEKALPHDIDWTQRLLCAKEMGFDFVEMSIDETDERLARLDWSQEERMRFVNALCQTGMRVPSICLSGHRRYPLGSHDKKTREHALSVMERAIALADDLGVRVIQLAGYDVYYEEKDQQTHRFYLENLKRACRWAAEKQVILAIEIMDDPFINSITKYLSIAAEINSPWLYVYPDLGNLTSWGNDVLNELRRGRYEIVGVHLKDTLPVQGTFKGQFKDVPFGAGCVDFSMCMRTLYAMEYNGPFLIEMWSEKSADWRAEVKAAMQYLVPIMRESGYDYSGKLGVI